MLKDFQSQPEFEIESGYNIYTEEQLLQTILTENLLVLVADVIIYDIDIRN